MKICPKCKKEHNEKGKFCSRSCANSRSFTKETEDKRSASAKKNHEAGVYLNSSPDNLKATKAWQEKRKNIILNTETHNLSHRLAKKKVLQEQENKCLFCGINEWNGKPIVLELDHIDGNNKNNQRDNLRCLCPNCHSQTITWKIGNKPHWKLRNKPA